MPVRADRSFPAVARSRVARTAARIGLSVAVLGALIGSVTGAVSVTSSPVAAASAVLDPAAGLKLFDPVPVPPPSVVPAGRAVTLDVPRLKIRGSSLVNLGVDPEGVVVPPESEAVAGWLTGSAVPGAVGPTVIAGHVDSYRGPGIFFRLDTMRAGDLVSVGRSDGVTVRFRVTDVIVVPKNAFPTEQVYGPTPGAELRLITCGGEFDHRARRYLRNVVVSAVFVDSS